MKYIIILAFSLIGLSNCLAQKTGTTTTAAADSIRIVEASCGQCQFGMKSKQGCDLAVRIDGKSYWVDGTDIHSHGDAHGKEGFCNAIRKAKVKGEVVNDKFRASVFELLPAEK